MSRSSAERETPMTDKKSYGRSKAGVELTDEVLERMARELKGFQNVILPGKNHMSAIAVGGPMPQQYIDSLVAFINSHDSK